MVLKCYFQIKVSGRIFSCGIIVDFSSLLDFPKVKIDRNVFFLSRDSRPSPFLPYADLVLRLLTSRVDRYSPLNLQIISAPERKM